MHANQFTNFAKNKNKFQNNATFSSIFLSSRDLDSFRLKLVFVGVGPEGVGLLGCGPGGRESEGLLDVLPDAHGAQDVEEDEAAVGEVLAHEVPVAEALHQGDGHEGQLGHDLALEDRVDHGEEGGEHEAHRHHRLHLDHHDVAVRDLGKNC